ncbi:unnamed protein product [marine sediment metagenome]|uniref:EamA domain-containing protein n=1 Tax=marine sediment metagenome TaxID=412755 RepID=X1I938_9ZZZZ
MGSILFLISWIMYGKPLSIEGRMILGIIMVVMGHSILVSENKD